MPTSSGSGMEMDTDIDHIRGFIAGPGFHNPVSRPWFVLPPNSRPETAVFSLQAIN